MKKLTIALAIGLACMMAAPALAVDFSVSGEFRVQGFNERDIRMNNTTSHSDSWYDTRLRLSPVFTVNDSVKILMRLDAHDGRDYGQSDNPKSAAGFAPGSDISPSHNIDLDRIWMSLMLPNNLGKLEIGRMAGGIFGYTWSDTVGERDRIKWTYGYGDWTFLALTEKFVEGDSTSLNAADGDSDGYAAAVIYKFDGGVTGILAEYIDNNTTATIDVTRWVVVPYVQYKVNDFSIEAEIDWVTGKNKTDNPAVVDTDVDAIDYNIDLRYQMGPAGFRLGYAYAQGDSNAADNKAEASAGFGDDWEYLWILTGSTGNFPAALGGTGNLSDTGGNAGGAGGKVFYLGADYQVLENLNLGIKVGGGSADEVGAGVDDSLGTEIDFTLSWKFMPAVTYDFVFAWLDAGDFWRTQAVAIPQNNFEDSVTVAFHRIKVNF